MTKPPFVREVRERHPDEAVEVWFEDEAQIGQQGTLTTIWAQKGSRPRAVKQTEYASVHISAVVNPVSGDALGLITDELNTETMGNLLRNLSKRLGDKRHAVLVWDNAGYHTSKKLVVPANITLLQLPSYSPELNCVENVWHWMRSHHLSNRAYSDLAAVHRATEESCARVTADRLKTVCKTAWLESAGIK